MASCLKVSRYSRMKSRPSATCSSMVGSKGVNVTPPGASVTNTVSPFSSFSRARISLGRITPSELPIWVTFKVVMEKLPL